MTASVAHCIPRSELRGDHSWLLMKNVTDPSLLTGNSSWDEPLNITLNDQNLSEMTSPSAQPAEVSLTSASPKTAPVVSYNEEDERRMALRMAALRTLRKRSKQKLEENKELPLQGSDTTTEHDSTNLLKAASKHCDDKPVNPAPSETTEFNCDPLHFDTFTGPLSALVGADTTWLSEMKSESKDTASSVAGENLAREDIRHHDTFEYRDVDAPDVDNSDMLTYGEADHAVVEPNTRGARQRISYADEFKAPPVAPSGDLGASHWFNRSVSVPSLGNAKHSKIKLTKGSRDAASKPLHRNPVRPRPPRFVEPPSRASMIIEWSDDEDGDHITPSNVDGALQRFSDQFEGDFERLASLIRIPSKSQASRSALSRKEREIELMVARIRELERRKQQGDPVDNTPSASSVLGKRSVEEAFGGNNASLSKMDVKVSAPVIQPTLKRSRKESTSILLDLKNKIVNVRSMPAFWGGCIRFEHILT